GHRLMPLQPVESHPFPRTSQLLRAVFLPAYLDHPRIHAPFSLFPFHSPISFRSDLFHILVKLTGTAEDRQERVSLNSLRTSWAYRVEQEIANKGGDWCLDNLDGKRNSKYCCFRRGKKRRLLVEVISNLLFFCHEFLLAKKCAPDETHQ